MSLDKSIAHGKEHRKPYRGAKAIDPTCCNHGSCEWCRQNRTHKFRDKESDTMRKQITYIADDGEEFATEEECYEYEHRLDGAKDSVIFLDEDFKLIPFDFAQIYDRYIYMVIMDSEKAKQLFDAIHDYEWRFVRPESHKDGDVLMWDADNEWYVDLLKDRDDLLDKIRNIAKAVNSMG